MEYCFLFLQVFRYSNETDSFKEFETLDSFGVVDQATLTVGYSLYLLLLSEVEEKLDVYEYYPLEVSKIYMNSNFSWLQDGTLEELMYISRDTPKANSWRGTLGYKV